MKFLTFFPKWASNRNLNFQAKLQNNVCYEKFVTHLLLFTVVNVWQTFRNRRYSGEFVLFSTIQNRTGDHTKWNLTKQGPPVTWNTWKAKSDIHANAILQACNKSGSCIEKVHPVSKQWSLRIQCKIMSWKNKRF